MHRLLKRQIKKSLGLEALKKEKLQPFFELINSYYKEIDKERLLLENALEVSSKELYDLNTQLRHSAFHDNLTKLVNRKVFEEELDKSLVLTQKQQKLLAVFFIDLDNFKTINDSLGHDVGDKLLVEVAKRLKTLLKKEDMIARWGGDEFILMLNSCFNHESVCQVADKILAAFYETILVEGNAIHVSASLGISLCQENENATMMIKNADLAMYKAKALGKNSYAFYSDDLSIRANEHMRIANSLLSAIENKEFVVVYQPQVDIQTGKIIGAEALVRWIHPEFGMISPLDFIPIAEEKGSIVEIGKIVLEQACIDAKRWCEMGFAFNNIAINISGKQIRHKDFSKDVKAIVEKTGIDPNLLEFEVTETLIMKEYEFAYDTLEELRAFGITLSIDDFGTGYSSLTHLKKLPIDKIKIDKLFVDDITEDEHGLAIAKAIIAMSHSLGLSVLAEGVESEGQLVVLFALGVQSYQGYYFSKPVPTEEFEALLFRTNVL